MRLKQPTNVATSPAVYDSETVRRTLARAAEIETQTENTPLSAAQIEALGQELGLSPAAVRRSLGETVELKRRSYRQSQAQGTASVSSRMLEIVKAVLPGLLFGLAVFCLLFECRHAMWVHEFVTLIKLGVLLVLSPLLAFWSGWRRRDLRLATLAGFVLGAAALLALLHSLPVGFSDRSVARMAVEFPAVSMLLAAVGAYFGRKRQQGRVARRRTSNR